MDFGLRVVECVMSMKGRAINLCRNVPDAEDLMQQTVLKALVARHQFVEGTNLHAWINTIMTNTFLTAIRGRKFDQITVHAEELEYVSVADPIAHSIPEHVIKLEEVRKEVADMTWRQQLAIVKQMRGEVIAPHERNSLAVAQNRLRKIV